MRTPTRIIINVVLVFLLLNGLVLLGKWKYPVKGLDEVRSEPEAKIVAVGSSHSRVFTSRMLDAKTITGNLGGADLFEVCYKVDFYMSHLKDVELVIYVISPFSFFRDNAVTEKMRGSVLNQRRMYLYGQYPQWEILPSDYTNFIAGFAYPLVTVDHWQKVFWGSGAYERHEDIHDVEKLNATALGKARKLFNAEVERAVADAHGDIVAKTSLLLKEQILRLRQSGVDVVLVTPPFWRAYVEALPKDRLEIMTETAEELASETGSKYLNYASDARFIDDPTLFFDGDHLAGDSYNFFSVFNRDLKEARAGVSLVRE